MCVNRVSRSRNTRTNQGRVFFSSRFHVNNSLVKNIVQKLKTFEMQIFHGEGLYLKIHQHLDHKIQREKAINPKAPFQMLQPQLQS